MGFLRREIWLVAAITLLAATLRFYGLGVTPPGFQFDEAFNAIDAEQVLDGNRPLFLPANAGREVVYTYYQAALAHFFGLNVFTLRLASAIAGTLAVPVAFWLLRVLLRQDSRAIALLTSLTLAINIWPIHFSHYAIRVILMPLVFSGVFGFAWLSEHASTPRKRLLAALLSGILLGSSVWVHPTGRLAPFVVVAFALWRAYQTRPFRLRLDSPLGRLVITGIAAFLVFLPLGIEFYRHPEYFTGHASEVSIFAERVSGGSPWRFLVANIFRVLGMFSITGDPEWTHGPVGRPVFDPLMAIVFHAGAAIWIWRLVRGQRDPDRDALFLLGLWSLVMLMPSMLSEAAPNYSRTLPALPAVFVAAGLGLNALRRWRMPTFAAGSPLGAVACAAILIISGTWASYDYFVRFDQSEEVYYLYDADKLDALEYLQQFIGENSAANEVYLSQLWGEGHSTVLFLRDNSGIKSVDTSDALVLPPPGRGAIYAFPAEQRERADQLAALWPGLEPQTVEDRFGRPLLYTISLTPEMAAAWPPQRQPTLERGASFVNAPTLLGMQATVPDKQVTLYWRADQPMARSLTTFVHLIDVDGKRVGQVDKLPGNGSYPTRVWTPGERVIDRSYPQMQDPCANGETLRVQVGWYELSAGGDPLPRADAPGNTALAGEMVMQIYAYPPEYLTLPNRLDEQITETLRLEGAYLHPGARELGAPAILDLFFNSTHQSGTPSPKLTEIAVSLEGASSTELWSGTLAPGGDWDSGKSICRRIRFHYPNDVPEGDYRISLDFAPPIDRSIPLENLALASSTRLYDAPEISVPSDAVFGAGDTANAIRLLGASELEVVPSDHPNAAARLHLSLVWQALTQPQGNYSVFVHIVDANGVDANGEIIAQSDAIPAGGYATNRWTSGEFIVDTHSIDIPARTQDNARPEPYRLLVGLYDPIGSERVPAFDAGQSPLPNNAADLGTLPPLPD